MLRFFSVFDIINYYTQKNELKPNDMYFYFRKLGIKKSDLLSLNENSIIPSNEKLLNAITAFTGLNKIELELLLGRIPPGYEDAFINQVSQ
jgi:hypothetical protein